MRAKLFKANITHILTKKKPNNKFQFGDSVDDSSGIEATIFDLPQGDAEGNLSLMRPEPQHEEDHWIVKGDYIVRVHRTPRRTLFTPPDAKDAPPIPMTDIDVVRVTTTDLENQDEKRIEDFWDGSSPEDHRSLSGWWLGETCFEKITTPVEHGHYMVSGRSTRKQTTTRPDNIWPEQWATMSNVQEATH